MTAARHAVHNGPTVTIDYTPATTSPTPAVRPEPWEPNDPPIAIRLATASHRETGEVLARVARLEARCDRQFVALVVTAAVALFAVAALVFTWRWLL